MLVAKLSLGALALNDIWFGGQTMNPWLLEEGASWGRALARGLRLPWAGRLYWIGSETGGSIVSPPCALRGYRTSADRPYPKSANGR